MRQTQRTTATNRKIHAVQKSRAIDGPVYIEPRRPHLRPGLHEMLCESASIENHFGRRVAKLVFMDPLTDDRVDCFMNLSAGPKTKYFLAWLCANNGHRPRSRQVLSVRIFTGKFFEVEIGETTRESDGTKLEPGQGYSVVRRIVSLRQQ